MKILVTPTSLSRDPDHPALQRLRAVVEEVVLNDTGRPLSEDELIERLPGVSGVIAGLDEYSARVIDAADSLRIISRYGVGTNNVDLDAADRRGIVVTRTPGANSVAVAELTIGLVFAVARGIPRLDEGVRSGHWLRAEGIELAGRRFGVIGFGAIGREVAARAAGLGMSVWAYDPMLPDDAFAGAGAVRADLDVLCARSDVVSLHVPLTPSTRHLLGESRIAGLPTGAIVVNTARGGLLDEKAARRALDEKRLHGVGVDVYETEPPSASPLLGHPRVVATPHAGGHTREAVTRMADGAVENLLTVLQGGRGSGAVSPVGPR